jgi:hypothetical protein
LERAADEIGSGRLMRLKRLAILVRDKVPCAPWREMTRRWASPPGKFPEAHDPTGGVLVALAGITMMLCGVGIFGYQCAVSLIRGWWPTLQVGTLLHVAPRLGFPKRPEVIDALLGLPLSVTALTIGAIVAWLGWSVARGACVGYADYLRHLDQEPK